MITKIPAGELIAIGSRYRSDYLSEQTGYTLGLAAVDGAALTALLPKDYLAEVKAAWDEVSSAAKNKSLVAAESKDATRGQNLALRQAKVWRRKASRRAMRAKRLGESIPDGLLKVSQARNLPALAAQLDAMTELFKANLAILYRKAAVRKAAAQAKA